MVTIGTEGNYNDNDVHDVPDWIEVFPPNCHTVESRYESFGNQFIPRVNNLQDLFNDVIEDEAEEDDLDPQNKVVPSIHVAQELAFGHDDSISHFILSFSDMNWYELVLPLRAWSLSAP